MTVKITKKPRQRAPSKRSLETRARILDAAEIAFARHGFDAASIREIAAAAGVPGALVHHHGGGKEELFFKVVARRAEELSRLRLDALEERRRAGAPDLRGVIAAFVCPFLDLALHGDAHWRAYGRLIAHVSADARWRPISEACFDPTARIFLAEIAQTLPDTSPRRIGAGFVFMVSSLLSMATSEWRIGDLAQDGGAEDMTDALLDFCVAGFTAIAGPP